LLDVTITWILPPPRTYIAKAFNAARSVHARFNEIKKPRAELVINRHRDVYGPGPNHYCLVSDLIFIFDSGQPCKHVVSEMANALAVVPMRP